MHHHALLECHRQPAYHEDLQGWFRDERESRGDLLFGRVSERISLRPRQRI